MNATSSQVEVYLLLVPGVPKLASFEILSQIVSVKVHIEEFVPSA